MTFRFATIADIPLLADANARLLEDERHRHQLTREQLIERWLGWLVGEYQAVLFEDERPVAYALFRPAEDGVYLRHFFVWRDRRRLGVGRAAFEILRREVWSPDARILLDVLWGNDRAMLFWRSLGFREHATALELLPARLE